MDADEMYERHAATSGRVIQDARTDAPRDDFVVQTLRERAPRSGPHRIAELSVGDGGLTRQIVRQIPGCFLTGFEISQTRIDSVRASLARLSSVPKGSEPHGGDVPRANFLTCNLDSPFHDLAPDGFHSVVAMDVLEHVFDVFGFIDSCARMLESRGTLILRVPNIAYVKHRLTLLKGGLPVTASWFGPPGTFVAWRDQYGWDGSHLHLFTLSSLTGLLELYGLRVVFVGDPGARLGRLRQLMPGLLCGNLAIVAEKR